MFQFSFAISDLRFHLKLYLAGVQSSMHKLLLGGSGDLTQCAHGLADTKTDEEQKRCV